MVPGSRSTSLTSSPLSVCTRADPGKHEPRPTSVDWFAAEATDEGSDGVGTTGGVTAEAGAVLTDGMGTWLNDAVLSGEGVDEDMAPGAGLIGFCTATDGVVVGNDAIGGDDLSIPGDSLATDHGGICGNRRRSV